jgi:hypothetical protein
MEALFARFDFDCHVTVNMINERALAAVYTISYDAEDEAESKRGAECYDAGVGRLFELGYPLYRASVRGMGLLAAGRYDEAFWHRQRNQASARRVHHCASRYDHRRWGQSPCRRATESLG